MWRRFCSAVSFLAVLLLYSADCGIQYSYNQKSVCPGEIVTAQCTIPAQTHHWRVPDLDIARTLSVRDWNGSVSPDFPFQFAVTDVMQNRSMTVITLSTATVNFTEDLDGVNVSCWDGNRSPIKDIQRTTITLKAAPGAPRTPSVTFPSPGQVTFTWDELLVDVDGYLVNISGPDDQCGSRDKPYRLTENSFVCSGWSPTGQMYAVSVQATNCGGDGPASDMVTVYLQKPVRPTLTTTPSYDFSGRLLEIESQAIAGDPEFIADGVDSSPTEYIFTYDSGSESLPFPEPCTGSSCQHTFRVTNSSRAQQYTVSVAVRNILGVGTSSAPVTIGVMNDVLAVYVDICIPEAICQFRNNPVASASCEISFSSDPTSANVDSANGTNTSANVTVPLSTKLQPDILYYYDVLAVIDDIPVRMKGTYMADQLCEDSEETPPPVSRPCGLVCVLVCALGIGVLLVMTVVVVIILYICCRKRFAKKPTDVENSESHTDGAAEQSFPLLQVSQHARTKARTATPKPLLRHPPQPGTAEETQGDGATPEPLVRHPPQPGAAEETQGDGATPEPLVRHPPQPGAAEETQGDGATPEPLVRHPPQPGAAEETQEDGATPEPLVRHPPQPGAAEETQGDGATPEPLVRHPPQPGAAEETQEDGATPEPLVRHPPQPGAAEETQGDGATPEPLVRHPPQPGAAEETQGDGATPEPLVRHPPQPGAAEETQEDGATPEPLVRHPPQPGAAEETQEDGADLNAHVLQSSFSSDVMYRFLSISEQEPTSDSEETFINNAVMETQGTASSEVVNHGRLTARTPASLSLRRDLEGNRNEIQSGMIPDLSPFPIHGAESGTLGPQGLPMHDPAASSGLIVPPPCVEHPVPDVEPDEHPPALEEHLESDEHSQAPEEQPLSSQEQSPALYEHTGPEEHPAQLQ